MQIYLDDSPLPTDARTLAAVLDAAQEQLADNRLIVEIRLDGQELSQEQLEAIQDQTLNAEEVELVTASPHELARQTLLDLVEALSAAAEHQQRAAEHLQADDPQAAMGEVREALTVWQQGQEAVLRSAEATGLSLEGMEIDGRALPELIQALADGLNQVRDQVNDGDWLGLADTLAYDLAEMIPAWQALAEQLAERIERERPTS
jgi:hypothetical protein